MIPLIYFVGTGTSVGKTTLVSALLRAAPALALRLAPFKPAQSGSDEPSDAERLADALGPVSPLDRSTTAARIAPLCFAPPIAPGLADDPRPFLAGNTCPDPEALCALRTTAFAWAEELGASALLVEGAGGLRVPMPGASWQSDWIVALSTITVVVGRVGLGTIDATLATIEGLRALGRPPRGFVLVALDPAFDPAHADDATVIARRSLTPCLGTLPFDDHEGARATAILRALLPG